MPQVQLGYFTLDTADIGKARAFYSALFGWSFNDDDSRPTYAHVTDSAPAFGFVKAEHPAGETNLYFKVEDIAATCARIIDLGGKASIPAESATGLSCTVCDDQGFSFSLWQPGPGF